MNSCAKSAVSTGQVEIEIECQDCGHTERINGPLPPSWMEVHEFEDAYGVGLIYASTALICPSCISEYSVPDPPQTAKILPFRVVS